MKSLRLIRYAITIGAASALLAACGGSQSPIAAPGTMPYLPHSTRPNSGKYQVLYSFGTPPDGGEPTGALIDVGGTLYGTTEYGGAHRCDSYYYGCGTIFSLEGGTEHVVHSFIGSDGVYPIAALTNVNGVLYGTASAGGTHDWGTVFGVTASGAETVLHDFSGKGDGGLPSGSLIDVGGKLYGTTRRGGTHNQGTGKGTVFRITTSGGEKMLHRFGVPPDGDRPFADLVHVGDKFYGTTSVGGKYGNQYGGGGTVFTITTRGAEKVIHSFKGPDGEGPTGGLVDVGGTFYGTTSSGGAYNGGTVFSISPSGNEKVLHSFGNGADGNGPNGSLIAVKGRLYGTTSRGGSDACLFGCGTVFSITTSGVEYVIYNFGANPDGNAPGGGLLNVGGTLYGTTTFGGTSGNGTVFALTP